MIVTISIVNTDAKLNQSEWNEYVQAMDLEICWIADWIHFRGGSNESKERQHYIWVVDCMERRVEKLTQQVRLTKEQSSTVFVSVQTEMLKCGE